MTASSYAKTAPNIAPAPTGSAGSNDVTSGMQLATANGTIGNNADSQPTNLPGQSIGAASSSTFHAKNT